MSLGALGSGALRHGRYSGQAPDDPHADDTYGDNPFSTLSSETVRQIIETYGRVHREAEEALRKIEQEHAEIPDDELPDGGLY